VLPEVRVDERTDDHNAQPLRVGSIEGRFRQRVAEMTAAEGRRNFGVHKDERGWTAFVHENRGLAIHGEFESMRVTVVSDGQRIFHLVPRFSSETTNVLVSKTINEVIVDHPDRLHIRIDDGGADETEATAFEILAERV